MNLKRIDLSKKDILIVDDLPDNLRVLSSMLTKEGYNVRKALSGQMALTACQTVLPDLIILDIMMPEMDGYEVCQKLKAKEKTQEVPVIFISALDEVFDKVKAFKAGGVDYIIKPFQVEEVLARIQNQLTVQQLLHRLTQQNTQLQQLNSELLRSNAELEQFAYVASHDLQSPLQTIIISIDLLNARYKDSLDVNVDRHLDRIASATLRMKTLIQDLLSYSRAGRNALDVELTDCTVVLKEALANLDEAISSSNAKIIYSELPTVMADGTQLMRLFQNLISNAIKFRRPEVPPEIDITTVGQHGDECIISVRDNGIGIAPEHFDRIFEIFQRLHAFDKYPGNGIGMSICKKIVERHGGRIWLESQVGVGTSFYFTIPHTVRTLPK